MGNTSSQDLLQILLLHNYEDVYNLAPIASLLALPTFFEGDFTAAGCEISDDGQSLLLKLTPGYEAVTDLIRRSFHLSASLEGSFSSPVKINVPGGVQFEISLCVSDRDLLIRIPVYRRELKLFLPDYKNYYYLPAEDYCVHKSLGSLLSADAAVKCTAATCYTKKEGNFVPSSAKKGGNIAKLTYLYQTGYKDTCRYLPAEVLQEDDVVQKEYVLDILHALL